MIAAIKKNNNWVTKHQSPYLRLNVVQHLTLSFDQYSQVEENLHSGEFNTVNKCGALETWMLGDWPFIKFFKKPLITCCRPRSFCSISFTVSWRSWISCNVSSTCICEKFTIQLCQHPGWNSCSYIGLKNQYPSSSLLLNCSLKDLLAVTCFYQLVDCLNFDCVLETRHMQCMFANNDSLKLRLFVFPYLFISTLSRYCSVGYLQEWIK